MGGESGLWSGCCPGVKKTREVRQRVNKLSQLLAVEVRGAPLHSLPLQQLTCFPDLQELEEVLRHSLLCWKIVREARPIVSKFNPAAQKEGKSGHKGGFLRLLVVG